MDGQHEPNLNQGVMVGGPAAGRWLASRQTFYEVAYAPPLAMPYGDREVQQPIVVEKTTYRWFAFSASVGCWAPADYIAKGGLADLIAELCANYHPKEGR